MKRKDKKMKKKKKEKTKEEEEANKRMSIIDALGCVLMLAKSPHIRSSEKGKREFELSGRKEKERAEERCSLYKVLDGSRK